MPGYVSRESADRWNHAARSVAGGGAGSHFVPQKYRPPKGGNETIMVIARALVNVNANTSDFTCKIKATITGPSQTFNETITVENLRAGDYVTPDDDSAYGHGTGNGEVVAILLRGMNIIAVKARDDFSRGTGWQWLQSGGVFLPVEAEEGPGEPEPPPP